MYRICSAKANSPAYRFLDIIIWQKFTVALLLLSFVLIFVGCSATQGIGKKLEKTSDAVDAVVAYIALVAPEDKENPLIAFIGNSPSRALEKSERKLGLSTRKTEFCMHSME